MTFRNNTLTPVDCRVLFPMAATSCLYDMSFQVGYETIQMKIERKLEAKIQHQKAKEEGRTSILSEQISDSLTEFQVANVPANTNCTLFVKMVKRTILNEKGIPTVTIPMTIPSIRGDVLLLSQILSGPFSFTLNSIRLTACPNINEYIVTLPTIQGTQGIRNGRFAALSVVNEGIGIDQKKKANDGSNNDIIFLLDCSGSMYGNPIDQVRNAMKQLLNQLPCECRFNVVMFGSSYSKMFHSPVDNTRANLKKAQSSINSLQANMGGTELYQPLSNILLEQSEGRVRQVFLLTDGAVSNRDDVVALVHQNRSSARIFTVGIGNCFDLELIQGIADVTMGVASVVQNPKEMSKLLMKQVQSAILPAITNPVVRYSDGEMLEASPNPIPPLFLNAPVQIMVKSSREIESCLSISGNFRGTFVNIGVDVVASRLDENVLKALFAFDLIQDLYQKEISYKKSGASTSEIVEKIINLSLEGGVISKYTAFIGSSALAYTQPKTEIVITPSVSYNIQQMDPFSSSVAFSPSFQANTLGGCAPLSSQVCSYASPPPPPPPSCSFAPPAPTPPQTLQCCFGAPPPPPPGGSFSVLRMEKSYDAACECECDCLYEDANDECFESAPKARHRSSQGLFSQKEKRSHHHSNQAQYSSPQPLQTQMQQQSRISVQDPFSMTNHKVSQQQQQQQQSNAHLDDLLRIQDLDGSWKSLSQLMNIGVKSTNILTLSQFPLEEMKATLLVLALLRMRYFALKNQWLSAETKALTYLSQLLPTVNFEMVISDVMKYI